MSAWKWASAKCIGTSHMRSGAALQDAYIAFTITTTSGRPLFCAVVSDGAGSAKYGEYGSALTCRSLSVDMRRHFRSTETLPDQLTVEAWIDSVRDRIFIAACKRSSTPRDFAATCVAFISDGEASLIVHIGDGAAVLRDKETSGWLVPSWPNNGEYSSTTYFVTDNNLDQLRYIKLNREIDAVLLFSDGIERLALDFISQEAFAPFCETMVSPLMSAQKPGHNRELSNQLKMFLAGDKVNSRTDDDKSLVIAHIE